MTDVYDQYRAKFVELVSEADERKAAAEEIQQELDAVNAQIEELRVKQDALVLAKSDALGGQSYLDLKKHIAALAKLLSGK